MSRREDEAFRQGRAAGLEDAIMYLVWRANRYSASAPRQNPARMRLEAHHAVALAEAARSLDRNHLAKLTGRTKGWKIWLFQALERGHVAWRAALKANGDA